MCNFALMDIKKLIELQKYLKISQICKEAGINPASIRTKIQRQTELSVKESNEILKALERAGIKIT